MNNKDVEDRIHRAMRRGSERLSLFSSGRRYRIAPSPEVLLRYGPNTTGTALLQALEKLGDKNRPSPQPKKEDFEAWKRIFPNSKLQIVGKGEEKKSCLNKRGCSEAVRDRLEPRLRTNEWFWLNILGIFSQQKQIRRTASHRTWDASGFYDIYMMLLEARAPTHGAQHDALVTVARMAAYTVCLIEDYSYVEEIGYAADCLTAIMNGALPIAYSRKTKTIYLGNWYNL